MSFTPMPGSLPSSAAQYDLAFQVCPIMLQGGIVAKAQGKLAPITNYLPAPSDDGEPFCRFLVVPGGTLISQSIGEYPFANQAVAANATIKNPLEVSMLMIAPVNQPGGYLTKASAFTTLQQSLAAHNAAGGTYFVATPAFLYNYVILQTMTDVSEEIEADGNKQAQILWQMDFRQPIVSLSSIVQPLNGPYSDLDAGVQMPNPPMNSGFPGASPATLTGIAAALETFGTTIPTTGSQP